MKANRKDNCGCSTGQPCTCTNCTCENCTCQK